MLKDHFLINLFVHEIIDLLFCTISFQVVSVVKTHTWWYYTYKSACPFWALDNDYGLQQSNKLLFVALFNLLFSANKWWAKNKETNFLNYLFPKFLQFWKIFLKSHIVTCSFHLEKWQKVGKNTKDGIETYFSHK